MAVKNQSVMAGPFVGDGKTTRFACGFSFMSVDDLLVEVGTRSVRRLLKLNHDYAVLQQECMVVLLKPLAQGELLTIKRRTPKTQGRSYEQWDTFTAHAHEQALDKLTLMAQELQYEAELSARRDEADVQTNVLAGVDDDSRQVSVAVGDGLKKEHGVLELKPNVGLVTHTNGVSVLYGKGLGIYENAIVVTLGKGLEFDENFQVQLKNSLQRLIEQMNLGLIDLEGFVMNMATRVASLEGGEVSIQIGNGLRYNEEGQISIRAHTGILVDTEGVSVRIGETLMIDADGNVQLNEALIEEINNKATQEGLKALEERLNGLGVGGLPVAEFEALPTEKRESTIFVIDRAEFYIWVDDLFFTGYQSPHLGELELAVSEKLKPSQLKANGATVRKDDVRYSRLWADAQRRGLVLSKTDWQTGTWFYADVDAEYFRVPDLSDQSIRFTGIDKDSNRERKVGSKQSAQLLRHSHSGSTSTTGEHSHNFSHFDAKEGASSGLKLLPAEAGTVAQMETSTTGNHWHTLSIQESGGSDMRVDNTAFIPVIHI